ncbi:hypothetical protein ABNQ39_36450 (plasmid) [Azospirillum sp. A26]|uniref:hypothetical protein n=1 Tax=Azospirillum sp. A26 TaxID=3160607 RepID=UPI00366C4FFC
MSSASISPPAPQEWRLCARTIIEALAQACPFAAGLATIYRYTHPSQMDLDIEKWRADISGRVNDHSAAIAALAGILTPRLGSGPINGLFWMEPL